MNLVLPREKPRDKSVDEFEYAVMQSLFDPKGGAFQIEFSGVFVAAADTKALSYFKVEKVWRFKAMRPVR